MTEEFSLGIVGVAPLLGKVIPMENAAREKLVSQRVACRFPLGVGRMIGGTEISRVDNRELYGEVGVG
jgi:hypothetical protein